MQPRFIIFVAAAALFIPVLLLADGHLPQLFLGFGTLLFLAVFARGSEVETRQIVCAILVATTGEVVLSLGWGLYTYRYALIPLYVPFGHGLFYLLAAESARQPALRHHARAITRSVLVAGSVIAAVSLIFFRDQWGLLWWIAAAILVMRSRNQLMLSTCFVYTILLEWIGTAVGNWHWSAVVPWVGLRSANPPSGVGILYILLDLITVAIASSVIPSVARDLRGGVVRETDLLAPPNPHRSLATLGMTRIYNLPHADALAGPRRVHIPVAAEGSD